MDSGVPEVPPAVRILELATAGWMSAAVSAVAELGVADELVTGPRPVEDVAKGLNADPPTLYRLLRACADIGLFDESDGQVFTLTTAGKALCTDAPGSMRNFARWAGHEADRYTWTGLAQSVRTGQPAFAGVHGQPFWDYLRQHPDASDVFDKTMTDIKAILSPAVVKAYDFSSFTRIVDVGGGHGALLAAVLAANPGARGVLYDQPEVIAGAGEPLRKAGVHDRCELLSGDFLESVPSGGDAYLLSNILNDWDDEHSAQILANCRAAMTQHGHVLLVEAVMPGNTEPALPTKLMDLHMLVLCGGRQRTEAEFSELFARAGLELSRTVPAGIQSVVDVVKPTNAHALPEATDRNA